MNKFNKTEFLRFLFVGFVVVLVDFVVYQMLLYYGRGISLSKAISFLCGTLTSFLGNKIWTFKSKKFKKKEIACYIVLYSFTAIINVSINNLILNILSQKIVAYLCATFTSTILNFLGQKFLVFK